MAVFWPLHRLGSVAVAVYSPAWEAQSGLSKLFFIRMVRHLSAWLLGSSSRQVSFFHLGWSLFGDTVLQQAQDCPAPFCLVVWQARHQGESIFFPSSFGLCLLMVTVGLPFLRGFIRAVSIQFCSRILVYKGHCQVKLYLGCRFYHDF